MFCFIVNGLLDSQNDHSLSPCVLLSLGPLDFQGVPSPSPPLYKNHVISIFLTNDEISNENPVSEDCSSEILGEMPS